MRWCFQVSRRRPHRGQARRTGWLGRGWLLGVCLLLPLTSLNASCRNNLRVNSYDASAVRIPFGNVNLHDIALQPPGTLLASVDVPPTHYGLPGDTVLWICDEGDLEKLYFLVATNTASRYGGKEAIGTNAVYATWFPYVGLRQSMNGVKITDQWQRIPLTTVKHDGDKVHIRLQDLPTLHAELYRVAALPRARPSRGCTLPMGAPTPGGTAYACADPSSYIQLEGPGLGANPAGTVNTSGYPSQRFNGFGYRLKGGLSVSNAASCVVHNHTPVVRFSPISVSELEAKHERVQNFNVELKCSQWAESGTASGKGYTAISLQASPGAFAAAQRLKMVEPEGGVRFLVSDQYGIDKTLATGVGIALYSNNGTFRRYFSSPGQPARGPDSGWYAFQQHAEAGIKSDGYQLWTLNLTAVLTRLPGQKVTPGKLHATAHVEVKVP